MTNYCISAIVTGKVQGVFYRDSARQKAEALGVTGWVKNNDDGAVELHACGDEENVRALLDWLWEGPSAAQVNDVIFQVIDEEKHDKFNII